jgi:ribosome-associated protein
MTIEELKSRIPESEYVVVATKSSGPGGQNVNKVNSKVEIRFSIKLTKCLSESEKKLVFINLKNRINSVGELVVRSESERTQFKNKKKAIEKILILISESLTEKPLRTKTTPSVRSRKETLDGKKKRGKIKQMRSDIELSPDDE